MPPSTAASTDATSASLRTLASDRASGNAYSIDDLAVSGRPARSARRPISDGSGPVASCAITRPAWVGPMPQQQERSHP